jgi:hypothetical protein
MCSRYLHHLENIWRDMLTKISLGTFTMLTPIGSTENVRMTGVAQAISINI